MSEKAGRVVLDTNVFVGASFKRESASASLVRWVKDGRLSMPWTDETLREIRRVLEKIPPVSWNEFEDLFRPDARRSGPLRADELEWVPDPDDRKFAALARATDAVLVSNDRHLLDRRSEASFVVLTPGEYVEGTNSSEERRP